MDKTFEEIKDLYNKVRNTERLKIVRKLQHSKFKAGGRQGSDRYSSKSKIDSPYNLNNWKWIVARRGDIGVLINLQTLEQDSRTKNIHVLFDRINIDVFKDPDRKILSKDSSKIFSKNFEKEAEYFKSIKERYKVENVFDSEFVEKTITDLELPLSEKDLEHLVNIIEKKIEELKSEKDSEDLVNITEEKIEELN